MTWQNFFSELSKAYTLYFFVSYFLIVFLLKTLSPAKNIRLFRVGLILILHVLFIFLAVFFQPVNSEFYKIMILAAQVLSSLAIIQIVSLLLFKIVFPRMSLKFPKILEDLLVSGFMIVAIFTQTSAAGYNVSGLLATSAVLTAVIGLSLQSSFSNIFGGLMLQIDNSIQVGDWITVNDKNGRVSEITWRYTALETRNWETVIIPNSEIIKALITVQGKRTGKPLQLRRWIYFNVDFRHSPSDIIRIVSEALQSAKIENVATEPALNCILFNLDESYGRYAVRYWLTNLEADDPTDSEVRNWIYFALKRSGISFSIPAQALFVTQEDERRKEVRGKNEIRKRIQSLDKVDLFHVLSFEEKDFLARKLISAPFTKGEVITRQGSEAHWLYIICSGSVSVRVFGSGEDYSEVTTLHDGDFFGEMSLMTGEPRSATIIALTDVECYRLDKEAFKEIIHRRPDIAEHIASLLSQRKGELENIREHLEMEKANQKDLEKKSDILSKIRDFFGLPEHFV